MQDGGPEVDLSETGRVNGEQIATMQKDAPLRFIMWYEVMPRSKIDIQSERDGIRERKRSLEDYTETGVNRVRLCMALVIKKRLDKGASFTLNSALIMMKRANFNRISNAQPDLLTFKPRPKSTFQQVKKVKTFNESAMEIASDRPLHSDNIVAQDHWNDVGRAIFNQQDCPWVQAWDSAEAQEIMKGKIFNDRMNPFLGAGRAALKGTVLEYTTVEDFFGFMVE